jgi:hypothetical protein
MNKISQIGIVLLIVLTTSCNKDNENKNLTGCDSTNTVFNQLYNSVLNTPQDLEDITMDTELHSYTFEVSSPATICKIGYRSQPTFETIPYLIEIYNNTTSTIVYSGNHTFSSSNTEYVSITPVVLTVGNSYTIKRIQNNFTNDITIFLGRVIEHNNGDQLNFPYTFGNLTITGSSFGVDAGSDNYLLPYIDIVFE